MSVIHGDCLEVMAGMEPESVDAIVTDPPYGLGFMGKAWDHGAPGIPFWREMLRVARPSSYLLAFGGTRTVHRIATSIEDAGWIIRDMLVWAYASGFPKSKASLKPAWEPIVMARKPGPLRMLAIDECRIPAPEGLTPGGTTKMGGSFGNGAVVTNPDGHPAGRWPANVILTDPIFDGGVDGVVGGGWQTSGGNPERRDGIGYRGNGSGGETGLDPSASEGTYSRFFLIPKADRTDREPVLGGLPVRRVARLNAMGDDPPAGIDPVSDRFTTSRQNVHPTVKPTDLMRHLVRLVTPAGGTVLDPFLGSGSTGIAAEQEGFAWIGIEKEAEYCEIARARLNGVQRGLGLDLPPMPPRQERLAVVGVDPQLLLGMAGPTEGDEVA